jgi:hypothetical protein
MSSENNPSFFTSLRFKYGLGLAVFLAIAGYVLWEEHEALILGNLQLILILGACVSMYLFMHRGHGHGHGKTVEGEGEDPANVDKKEVEK